MSSGPFVDRIEAEKATKEIERYLFEDGLAGTLVEFLKFLSSLPADKRPSQPTECLLKELGIPHQNTNPDVMMNILKKTRAELERGVLENSKLRVRLNELCGKLVKEDQKTSEESSSKKEDSKKSEDGSAS